MPRRTGLSSNPGHRRSNRLLRALRAPRPAVLRARLRRLHRPRAHHRDLKAYSTGAIVCPPFHRAGADWPANRRYARSDSQPAWGGGLSRGAPSLYPDARGSRKHAANPDNVLARSLRRQSEFALRILYRLWPPALTPLEPFETLYDAASGNLVVMPEELSKTYGPFLLPNRTSPVIIANFVST